jgi:hypothetical protein
MLLVVSAWPFSFTYSIEDSHDWVARGQIGGCRSLGSKSHSPIIPLPVIAGATHSDGAQTLSESCEALPVAGELELLL